MTYQEALQLADELKARFDAGFSTSEKRALQSSMLRSYVKS